LLLAWETLFPTMGPLPVTSHTRAMWTLRYSKSAVTGDRYRPLQTTFDLASASPRQEKGGGIPPPITLAEFLLPLKVDLPLTRRFQQSLGL
jgi:hypothetical protein